MLKLIATCLLVLIQIVRAKQTGGPGLEVFEGFNVDLRYNQNTQKVDFTFILPDKTWLGIILGSQMMRDSDIIQVVADGANSKFYDLHGVNNTAPLEDFSNDLTGSFEFRDGQVTFRLTRDLDTLDFEDFLIPMESEFLCAWALNRVTSTRKTKHTAKGMFGLYLRDDSVGRSYSSDLQNPDEIPLLEWNRYVNYDTDFQSKFLPTGPIPTMPTSEFSFFKIPASSAAKSGIELMIIAGGWTLDGQIGRYQSDTNLNVTSWQKEVWYEQGVAYFYHNNQFTTSGWVLYGEFQLRKGLDLADQSYLLAGFETYKKAGKTRAALYSKNKKVTMTNQSQVYDMQDPKPMLNDTYIQKCDSAFGDNPCNGIGGVFGQAYRAPTNDTTGLWQVWLWLPDTYQYQSDYWDWKGTQITPNAWIGEYNATTARYFQYGGDLVISFANALQISTMALAFGVLSLI